MGRKHKIIRDIKKGKNLRDKSIGIYFKNDFRINKPFGPLLNKINRGVAQSESNSRNGCDKP